MTADSFLPTRRQFNQTLGAGAASLVGLGAFSNFASAGSSELIREIETETVFPGRNGEPNWFHPRACVEPHPEGDRVLMTMQSISGSDVFGPVQWTETKDLGKTWSPPTKIDGLGRRKFSETHEVGVCDVVPQFHPQTGTTIAMGHNVYYKDGRLARPQLNRWPVYTIRTPGGDWSEPQKLVWDDPRGSFIYTCNCGQRLILDNGEMLIAFTYGNDVRQPRFISTVRCTYDGQTIKIVETGNALKNTTKRGLLEPSLVKYRDKYYVTIRAEDDRGYVAASDDGLNWQPQQAWMWENGEPLTMSTTQQHWLAHSEKLYLVYTRKDTHNINVIRWRAPLYISEVNLETMRLKKETEQILLPLRGDGVNQPKQVAMMGNFNITPVTPEETWVTVGECLPYDGYKGDTLLARVKWQRENGLVG